MGKWRINHHQKAPKGLAVLLSLSLVGSLATVAAPAFANGTDKLVKTYTYMKGEGEPEGLVLESVEHDGTVYTLNKKSEPREDDAYEPETKEIETDVTVKVDASDISNARAHLPATVEASTVDERYVGDLALEGVEQDPIYLRRTRQVDRTVDYTGLPTNDVDAVIPSYGEFVVTSGDAVEATTTKTLALSDVEFEVTATDDLGLPTEYTAHANYRGTEDYLDPVAYNVTGHYSGIATEVDRRMVVEATYIHQAPVEPAPAPQPAPEPEPVQQFDPTPYAVAAGAAGAVLIAVAVVWRRRARITKTFDDGSTVVLARVRPVKLGDGAWSVRVPDKLGYGPKELRPTQRMMRFRSIAIIRDGLILRESAPAKVMQFDDAKDEATLLQEE